MEIGTDRGINVVGLGYIGLPTALMLAAHDIRVIGTDCNVKIVKELSKGRLTFEEPGLEDIYNKAVSKNIEFSSRCSKTNCYIIAVPTPYIQTSKCIDTKYVEQAVRDVLEVCEDEAIIVIESTISPGVTERVVRPIIEESMAANQKKIHLAHAPERILPGNMLFELENNSRTIGADEKEIGEKIKDIYESFCKSEIILTDIKTAEMTKVVENAYRDVNIAFANELSKICRKSGLDIYEVIKIANLHPRVNILQPGPGVGGHCIPVDPWFLVGDFPELANLVLTAREINSDMPSFVIMRIKEIMEIHGISSISKVGLYGLTYKEDVDDMRDSPALQLLNKLDDISKNSIAAYDPFVQQKAIVENQYFNFEQFVNDIELLVIMVGHRHIKGHVDRIKNKIILDTRNVITDKDVYKL